MSPHVPLLHPISPSLVPVFCRSVRVCIRPSCPPTCHTSWTCMRRWAHQARWSCCSRYRTSWQTHSRWDTTGVGVCGGGVHLTKCWYFNDRHTAGRGTANNGRRCPQCQCRLSV